MKIHVSWTGLLALLFIGLKLTDHIDWDWIWVLCPIWLPAALWLAATLIYIVYTIIDEVVAHMKGKTNG